MKIHILSQLQDGPFGGGNQFLKSLRAELRKKYLYVEKPELADVIIFNSFPFRQEGYFKQAFTLKRRGKILLHRIDGPFLRARDTNYEFDQMIYRYNKLVVDGTVFQSNWSCQENHSLGMPTNRYETVIMNAPDPDIFNDHNRLAFSRSRKIKLIASSWSTNPKKGFDVYEYLDRELDFSKFSMTFVGNAPVSFTNIRHLPPLNSVDLAQQLREHDIFVSASMIEACSNALLEAMHCGCVPLARNNSSHPEIVRDAGRLFDGCHDVLEKITAVVDHYESYKLKIKPPRIDVIARQYCEFAQKIITDRDSGSYRAKLGNLPSLFVFLATVNFWKFKHKIS